MNLDPQTWAALVIVALAAAYLLRRSLRRKRNAECGCGPDKFKAELSRPGRPKGTRGE